MRSRLGTFLPALALVGCAPKDVSGPPTVEEPAPATLDEAPVAEPEPEPEPPTVVLAEGAWVPADAAPGSDPTALRYERLRARDGSQPILQALIERTGDLHGCYRALLAEHPEAVGRVIINLEPPVTAAEPVDIQIQSAGSIAPPAYDLGLPGMDQCVRGIVVESLAARGDWIKGEALGPYVTLAFKLRPHRSDLRLRAEELGPDEHLRTLADGSCEIVRRRTRPCPKNKRCARETRRPGLCSSSRDPVDPEAELEGLEGQ